jgi:bifunctional oligoribonuclease and PAP phosphatase NrnA
MSSPNEKSRNQILDEIGKHDTFCIVSHIRPDGDCIGSQVGLALALKSQGKKVVCWNQDEVPTKLQFMVPTGMVQKPEPGQSFDCVIATDCAALDRLGRTAEAIAERKVFINIDHHTGNTRYADLNWVNSRKPSTGELIFEMAQHASWNISPAIADCLYTAVSTDTGSFMYPTTTPATYQTAAELVEAGANLSRICSEVYQSYPLSRIRLLRMLFNNFKLTHDNQIAYFWLKKEHFTRSGASRADSEGLIDHLRDIEPVLLAVVFEEVEDGLVRISLRSKSKKLLVNKIAAEYGGGGHHASAGARIEGKPMSVQRRIIRACRAAVDALHDKNGKNGNSK